MKKYYLQSKRREISCMKYVNGRLVVLDKFYVETAFYKRLLKAKQKEG
jgi:hypothetical protein